MMAIGRDGLVGHKTIKPADELAALPRRWEHAERTLRVVEATNDQLGVVYGELERVAQLLADERAKLEKLLGSGGDAG